MIRGQSRKVGDVSPKIWAAEILKVRRATLSDLLHGKAALTPEMALRIEKAFGPDMDHLRMQLAYDVAKTREKARDISIKRYVPA
jgi:antitoxin HigA-1